jgi:lysophospholipase L1-like esterase
MTSPADVSDAPSARLLIIGDSITLAAVEVRGKEVLGTLSPSYVELLRERLPQVEIITDAAVRRTTIGARERLGPLLEQHAPDVVVLMVGTSDADLDWRRFVISKGQVARSHVTVERYADNLRAMIAQVRAAGATPILTDLPNHEIEHRTKYFSGLFELDLSSYVAAGGGQAESDRRWREYCTALATVASEAACEIAQYGRILDTHPGMSMFGPDATHPSAEAHRIIAQVLDEVLQRVLAQRRPARRRVG